MRACDTVYDRMPRYNRNTKRQQVHIYSPPSLYTTAQERVTTHVGFHLSRDLLYFMNSPFHTKTMLSFEAAMGRFCLSDKISQGLHYPTLVLKWNYTCVLLLQQTYNNSFDGYLDQSCIDISTREYSPNGQIPNVINGYVGLLQTPTLHINSSSETLLTPD